MTTNLKQLLADKLTPSEREQLIGSYDVVGDIAIIQIPQGLTHHEKSIGDAVLQSNSRIKTILKRAGIYQGEFRTLPLEHVAGEKRKHTEVKEFGLHYLVNPECTYFSVRSGNERRRIASLVKSGERVLVLFSGIAPYPLMIAKYSDAARIIGVEKNPRAHEYGLKNIRRNKYEKKIELVQQDATLFLKNCQQFDRIIMPLPKGGEEFLQSAITTLAKEGSLHFYQMQHPDRLAESEALIIDVAKTCGRNIRSTRIVRCGHCSPRRYRICTDAVII